VPASATVQILSVTPSPASPQVIGRTITWTATAVDTNTGPLTFRTYVTAPGGTALMVRDFLPGTHSGSTWTSVPFAWLPAACTNMMSAGVDLRADRRRLFDRGCGEGLHLRPDCYQDGVVSGDSAGNRERARGGADREPAGVHLRHAGLRDGEFRTGQLSSSRR
jgi:hypothetical protein